MNNMLDCLRTKDWFNGREVFNGMGSKGSCLRTTCLTISSNSTIKRGTDSRIPIKTPRPIIQPIILTNTIIIVLILINTNISVTLILTIITSSPPASSVLTSGGGEEGQG